MTVATNALLEGRGARTALVATEGFTDVVELGRQARRRALPPVRRRTRAPLAPPELRFAAPERMAPDGVLRALDATPRATVVERRRGAEPEAVAVCLLHAYRHPDHERALGEALRERAAGRPRLAVARGRRHVPRVRARGDDRGRRRALAPAARATCAGCSSARATPACPSPAIMQSSGGLADARRARPTTPR